LQPLSDNGSENTPDSAVEVASAESDSPKVESEPEAISTEEEAVSAESSTAGEKDPAA
jgi:hypothetical protein